MALSDGRRLDLFFWSVLLAGWGFGLFFLSVYKNVSTTCFGDGFLVVFGDGF